MSMPDLALGGHLGGGGGEAGGAEVLERDEQPGSSSSSEHSSSFFSSKGSPTWTVGRLCSSPAPRRELGRGEHGGAADAVAAGGGAEQHEHVAGAGGGAAHEPLAGREPEGHRVDEAVVLVGALEVDLAADGGHADRVAVVADARTRRRRAGSGPARSPPGSPKRSESSTAIGRAPIAKMSRRMPPTPVAAPWKGSTALGWLWDSTLNAQTRPPPTSTAPAFSPGPMTTCGALGGQRAQQLLGVLVGAVLAPQQRVHRQLDLVGRSALLGADELVLGSREAERERVLDASAASPRSRHDAPSTARRIDSKIHRPSVEPPVSSSTACSGWGIRPKTLPASLQTPAMSSERAVEVLAGGVAQDDLAAGLHRVERVLVGVVAPPGVLGGDAQLDRLPARRRRA